MKDFDYNPFGPETLSLRFNCDKCGKEIETDDVYIPSPDFTAETSRDSTNEYEETFVCPNCDKEYEITLYSSFGGGQGQIDELDDECHIVVTENYDDYELEAILSNTEYHDTFKASIDKIERLMGLKVPEPDLLTTYYNSLFVNVVTVMETYLSDAFLNTINSKSEEHLKRFVVSHPRYNEKKIKMSELYPLLDKIKAIALNDIKEMSFHNILETKKLFERALRVEFPKVLKHLIKIVENRHDLVHRNGKTDTGLKVEITIDDIKFAIGDVSTFVDFIDLQVARLK